LGFLIDAEKMIVTLTQEKKDRLVEECQKLISKKQATIREVARVLGLIVSSFSGVDYGQLFYREIEVEKIQALKLARGNFDLKMQISENVKSEMTWWVKNIHNQYRVLNRNNPQVVLQTDASLLGWGAVMNDSKTGGRWNYDERENHINYLELLAVFYALKAFQWQLKKFNHVKILSDNTTAVSYINHMGGVKSPCCNSLAKSIWFWAKQHKIWLTASHIAGKDNITADIQSRKFNDQVEWQLNKEIFKHICSVCGTPDIDLFASCLNTLLEKFCAWKPDPDASFIDAFSIDWSEYKCYMFPPFSLLGRCVKKVQDDKTTAILVAPLWPTQAWFSQTMQMLIDTPIMVQARNNLLSLPYKETVHPLRKTTNLIICQISGNSLLVKEYLLKLPISCCARGDKVLKNSTKYLSKDGFSTVAKGRLVKFRFL
jgi:ribonuclease HI